MYLPHGLKRQVNISPTPMAHSIDRRTVATLIGPVYRIYQLDYSLIHTPSEYPPQFHVSVASSNGSGGAGCRSNEIVPSSWSW